VRITPPMRLCGSASFFTESNGLVTTSGCPSGAHARNHRDCPEREAHKARSRTEDRADSNIIDPRVRERGAQLRIHDRPDGGDADADHEQACGAGTGVLQHIGANTVYRKNGRQTGQREQQNAERIKPAVQLISRRGS
jgi:hypothetical protein